VQADHLDPNEHVGLNLWRESGSMNGKNLVQWVLGLAFLFGCGNTQSGQAHCQTTADCERQGFSSHVCSPEGMCMPSTSGECKTNADCVDLTSSPVGRCLSAGKCVPLTQAGCTSILGDASRDDAIYVGLLAPLTGSGFAVELGKSITIAVDAAVQTYNQTVAEQPGDPRPLTVVI
jgi:hypothetical protein